MKPKNIIIMLVIFQFLNACHHKGCYQTLHRMQCKTDFELLERKRTTNNEKWRDIYQCSERYVYVNNLMSSPNFITTIRKQGKPKIENSNIEVSIQRILICLSHKGYSTKYVGVDFFERFDINVPKSF